MVIRADRGEPFLVGERAEGGEDDGLLAEGCRRQPDRSLRTSKSVDNCKLERTTHDDWRDLLHQGIFEKVDEGRENLGRDEWEKGVESMVAGKKNVRAEYISMPSGTDSQSTAGLEPSGLPADSPSPAELILPMTLGTST